MTALPPLDKLKNLTDEEIDVALDRIKLLRETNNHWFIEWLRTSFKCPSCQEAAHNYQSIIRVIDAKITETNKDL